MILPTDYIQNCREGMITICLGTVAIADRAYEICLGGLFFGTSKGYTGFFLGLHFNPEERGDMFL
jgi:hypothetical protein